MKRNNILFLLLLVVLGAVQVQGQSVVCPGDSVNLSLGGTMTGASIQWQFSSTPSNFVNIGGGTTDNYVVPVPTPTYYRAEITLGTCNVVYSDTQFVDVNPTLFADAGGSTGICAGGVTTLGGAPTASGGSGSFTYLWTPSLGLSSTTMANPDATPTVTTTYTLVVTDSVGCTATDSTRVTVTTSPIADAGVDLSINCGDSAIVGGSPVASGGTPPYTYNWTGPNLSSTTSANPTATPFAISNTYILTVTDANGCTGVDTMTVGVSGGAASGSAAFSFTGAIQDFIVPACVSSLTVTANGAQGGGSNGGAGGLGARIIGTFAVTPGETLKVVVGEQGHLQLGGNAQNSSGGGGGTLVYYATGGTLMVAAGGGGGKCNWTSSTPLHAAAAGQAGTAGGASSDGNPGGTAGNGGPAGLWSGVPCAGGGAGWLSAGGGPYGGATGTAWTGGTGYCGGGGGGCGGIGGYGGGGGGGNHYGGGGGGGGYSGGGGGTDPTHGGGGGSFNGGTSQTNTGGINSGNGSVTISW